MLQAVAALLRMSGRTLARVMADMYAGRMQQSLLMNKGVYGSKEIRSKDDNETNVLPQDMISSREIFEESVEQQLLELLQAWNSHARLGESTPPFSQQAQVALTSN